MRDLFPRIWDLAERLNACVESLPVCRCGRPPHAHRIELLDFVAADIDAWNKSEDDASVNVRGRVSLTGSRDGRCGQYMGLVWMQS